MKTFLVLSLFFAAACSKDDPSDPNTSVPDPEGTITVSMRNANNGDTFVSPDGFSGSFHIGADDNFSGYGCQFVTIGPMKGLGNVTKIPSSGWASQVAVQPGYGYVARNGFTYFRLYVVSYIEAAVGGGVIGADVKYQSPFAPTTLSLSTDALTFAKEQGEQTVTITTDASEWSYSKTSSWFTAGQDNNVLTVSVLANTGLQRSGIITIRAFEQQQEITVTQAAGSTSGPYTIGSLYHENGVYGIVYQVTGDGMHGMIVSAHETTATSWSTESITTGSSDMANGMNNMNTIKNIAGWEIRYPAFKWCNDLNTGGVSGWYLPARDELNALYQNRGAVNITLTQHGGSQLSSNFYWSSSEYVSYNAWAQYFSNGYQANTYNKDRPFRVRAVRAF
ncbi:MAG: DUF5036 family protein [Bacteroidales bacterium]|nr:DUF5036 family protein [Bacteroidales bacterium]MCL2133843.1 DUF5036 family protein [Bacteroidales bacterium]